MKSRPDSEAIKTFVVQMYRRIYREGASSSLPIRQGRSLASALGYSREIAGIIPENLWDRFLPCGNPLPYLNIQPGHRVLNLGSGVGVDSIFLAVQRPLPFEIVNLDISREALQAGRRGAEMDHNRLFRRISWVQGDAEDLPFRTANFHWVLMNGVFNLFPEKRRLLREVARVLKTGGTLVAADLIRIGPSPSETMDEPAGWAWCLNGAEDESSIKNMFTDTGFVNIRFFAKVHEAACYWRAVFTAQKKDGR